jgi:hypothetical protein
MEIVKMGIANENRHGNRQMEIVMCGTKINMGNEKYQNGNRQTAIPQWD